MQRFQVRQGDLLIEMINDDEVPANATPITRAGEETILARGESTGHHHALAERDVDLLAPTTSEAADRFLRIRSAGGAVVTHQEHAPIHLPPGTFRVRRQREYSPSAIRRVAD